MTDMICWLIGILVSISIYLILSRQIMRWLFGIVILSSTINLVIFVAGRLYSSRPSFISQENPAPNEALANPLPQALILTAIVIGFGLLAFSLILVRKLWRTFSTTDSDVMGYPETHPLEEMEKEA
ncbi:NADH-quinone oxidoreductase subunit K [Legionella jamestowniensis]|uniref:Na(+)/H(+) antiporter subunit C n=1 Tax=Legionella jamestowniensis TaxID=455 RepID=A0A0W0UZE6_9GAMM|nr:NADH-quinone oxidoreductase subunit K [Legionella jamestowniensis]KTD13227.1 Na(+)/H(+) antiporter subunit C [Legionella jamestowniensis]SFL78425.1 multisubunit sodium/proton antiporter, MrpC subunit [Legionella jamestowniensis DSM 19215]